MLNHLFFHFSPQEAGCCQDALLLTTPLIAFSEMVSFRCQSHPVASKILVVLWALSLWSQLDGFICLKQLRPRGVPLPVSRSCLPPGLDVEKWQDCTPKLLEADRFEQMLREAKKSNRTYPKNRNPRRVPDEQGRWKCNKCGQMLPTKAFTLRPSGGRKIPHCYCKECQSKIFKLFHRSLPGALQILLGSARSRAKEKGLRCNLTRDDLYRMIKRQHGRCAYSGVPMEISMPNSHWRMSLERRNNSRGYCSQNCVLVAAEFNTGDFSQSRGVNRTRVKGTAQWSPSKVQAVFELRRQEVDLKALHMDIRKALEKPKLHRSPCQAQLLDGPSAAQLGQICCSRCQRFLDPGRFAPSMRGGYCLACRREYNQAFSSTLRGKVLKGLGDARNSAKKRGQEFSLDLPQVLSMLERQGGRCYYSRVPLEYNQIHTNWRMSMERLDNSVGYTAKNCVLIAIEFNTADNSRNKATEKVFGTAQWSREKAEHIWGKDGWAKKVQVTSSAPK